MDNRPNDYDQRDDEDKQQAHDLSLRQLIATSAEAGVKPRKEWAHDEEPEGLVLWRQVAGPAAEILEGKDPRA